MGHVYADLDEFKKFNSGGDPGDTRNDAMLIVLESASRAVDGFCRRGSGFGPEIATRSYSGHGQTLHLRADLLDIDEVTVGGTITTDYTVDDPRTLTGPFGYRSAVTVEGTWGYWDAHAEVAMLAVAMTDIDTEATVDDASLVNVGDVLLIDTEQVLVTAKTGDVLTVRRAENGTTGDAHDYAAAVDAYRYPAEVVDATLRVAQRRWKARDAGITPVYGEGPGLPGTANMDTEASIMRMAVGHLRFSIVL